MWSAGLVLYALCYGDLPYHSDDPERCREQVMAHSVLPRLPSFRDQSLRDFIAVLTTREPSERPTAMEAERVSFAAVYRESEMTPPSPKCIVPASTSPSQE